MDTQFDVIIAGGGMVGATLAAALGHSSLRIALIESSEPDAFTPEQPHDLRVSAVSIASQRMFEAIGAWEAMRKMRACPYRQMLVWDGEKGGQTLFDSGELYQPVLGHIIENRVIQLAVVEVAKRLDNITWLCPERVEHLEQHDSTVSVRLISGTQLQARVLVGADGANSSVRRLSDIGIDKHPYDQHALVATVETALPQQDITWQRYVPSGPQAFLPLSGQHGSLVWYHTPDTVAELEALSDDALRDAIVDAFPERLGEIVAVQNRGSFPLIKSHAHCYLAGRVVLIGDAAHTIHPQAGQGVNLGLMDAAQLAEQLLQQHSQGRDIGHHAALRRYERARRGYNQLMISSMDAFYYAFRESSPPLQLARSLALTAADRIMPVKRFTMAYAMGLSGDLPQLAQGKLPT